MFVLIGIAILLSRNRKAIRLRTVIGAFALQFMFGAFVLYLPFGKKTLLFISDGVAQVIAFGDDGINFLFGDLTATTNFGFIFALRVLPVIIFFSALISVLYYVGIMKWVINILGGALSKLLGTSHTESLSATANIFVGQTEAPLVVRPFIKTMTKSELFAVMCGGLASVAGSVLAGYASMGVPLEYLIAASFMAAPGGLLFAKLIMPETEESIYKLDQLSEDEVSDDEPVNVIDAAASGAGSGLKLALNVGAMLLAFVGLIALVNGIFGGIGGWLFDMPELTLELILGYIFSPLAFLIGVPWHEANTVGSFIGQKLVVNEFVAYLEFMPYLAEDTTLILSEKSKAIVAFALCGFANFSSIAILLGGLGGIAPSRRAEIAKFGLLAVAA
ncbi:MAG: NupC/NupG family nucleoside CNT transporter, partial [Flavobacteriales bacterium]